MPDVDRATLLEVLAEELRVCTRLIEAMGRMQRALIAGDLDAMHASVMEQQGLVARVERLETTRAQAVGGGGGEGASRLSQLMPLFEGRERERAERLRERLREAALRMHELNRQNEALASGQLNVIERWSSILSAREGAGTYGQQRAPQRSRKVNVRV